MSREEYLAEFDELHLLGSELISKSPDEVIATLENLLLHAYLLGRKHTGEDLEFDEGDWAYWDSLLTEEEQARQMRDTIYKKIDGKDFEDRVREYLSAGDEMALIRVIETEYHRDYNAGGYDLAVKVSQKTGRVPTKVWCTMLDPRVRRTHEYLEAHVVPLGDEFYTYDGDHAPYPGEFIKPENNINCRCWLTYSDS